MRVNGEAFFLINGWMNYLSLLTASRMAHIRLLPGKALVSSALGAAYGMIAVIGKPFFRSFPMLLFSAFCMSAFSFGGVSIKNTLLVLASGWFLSGLSDFALTKHINSAFTIILCSVVVLIICVGLSGQTAGKDSFRLVIALESGQAELPVLLDNGNLLHESATGLPVIVIPEKMLKTIMPVGVNIHDLSTLPEGWRLIGIRTAAGRKTLMCFHPQKLLLCHDGKKIRIHAAVAISDFDENRALLPGSLCNER